MIVLQNFIMMENMTEQLLTTIALIGIEFSETRNFNSAINNVMSAMRGGGSSVDRLMELCARNAPLSSVETIEYDTLVMMYWTIQLDLLNTKFRQQMPPNSAPANTYQMEAYEKDAISTFIYGLDESELETSMKLIVGREYSAFSDLYKLKNILFCRASQRKAVLSNTPRNEIMDLEALKKLANTPKNLTLSRREIPTASNSENSSVRKT